jgi:hypothetical protein
MGRQLRIAADSAELHQSAVADGEDLACRRQEGTAGEVPITSRGVAGTREGSQLASDLHLSEVGGEFLITLSITCRGQLKDQYAEQHPEVEGRTFGFF